MAEQNGRALQYKIFSDHVEKRIVDADGRVIRSSAMPLDRRSRDSAKQILSNAYQYASRPPRHSTLGRSSLGSSLRSVRGGRSKPKWNNSWFIASKKGCKRLYTNKYMQRGSPPFSATEMACRGMRLRGNDGEWWQSVSNKGGIFSWKKA